MKHQANASIGVVVPVKNGQEFLEKALRSAANQTLKPRRLVVVDNGSSDGTLALLNRLQSHFNFDLIHESKPGASAARDAGWRSLTDCDLIAFLDADDVWREDKLEKQAALYLNEDAEDLVCVYCANTMIDARDNQIGCSSLPSMRGFVHTLVAQGHPVLGSMSAVLVKREALDEAGGFDQSLMSDEDLDLFIRLSKLGRFDFVPEYLTALRSHKKQTSRQAGRLLRSKGRILNKYPDLYSVGSSFVESVRVEHIRIDLRERKLIGRILVASCYPLAFGVQVRRSTVGRARELLFPGVIAFSCWLGGRALIYISNRITANRVKSL